MILDDQIFASFKNMKGTIQYFHNMLQDVLAKNRQLESTPSFCHALLQNFIEFQLGAQDHQVLGSRCACCIYSSDSPGDSFNFGFSKAGTYLGEALFRGRCSLIISKRHQNIFSLSL